ncbi:MAG: hypothetical protein ICV73_15710, partial [Acetobacteraceae bacterium]|nr:hypothetical protein [Acetobacteraceae bacterium]
MLRDLRRAGDRAEAARQAWRIELRNRLHAGKPLTVLEHTALACLLRTGVAQSILDDGGRGELAAMLAGSWLHLTGRSVPPGRLAGRLP